MVLSINRTHSPRQSILRTQAYGQGCRSVEAQLFHRHGQLHDVVHLRMQERTDAKIVKSCEVAIDQIIVRYL